MFMRSFWWASFCFSGSWASFSSHAEPEDLLLHEFLGGHECGGKGTGVCRRKVLTQGQKLTHNAARSEANLGSTFAFCLVHELDLCCSMKMIEEVFGNLKREKESEREREKFY